MKEYRGYKIPEVTDLNGFNKTIPVQVPIITVWDVNNTHQINTALSLEDISGLSEEVANKLIYEKSTCVVDEYLEANKNG